MSDPNSADLVVGSTFQERYEVVRIINAGGMGAVYEVIHLETKRHRALKVMLPSVISNPEMRERFKREATVAASINSEHIVETLDAGVDHATGAPFIVMELLIGEDLGEVMKRRGALPAVEVVDYFSQVAHALDRTHAAGIVHRDLKPENLFVTARDDGSPRIKVLDFGIAKATAGVDGTQTKGIVGTPLYMAPEQAHGKIKIGPAADLYAMGHIAFALLTGAPYWDEEAQAADGVMQLLLRVLEGASEAATARAARRAVTLPPAFDAWFTKATSLLPDDRFATGRELADTLAGALGIQPMRSSSLSLYSMPVPSSGAPSVMSTTPSPPDPTGTPTRRVSPPNDSGVGATVALPSSSEPLSTSATVSADTKPSATYLESPALKAAPETLVVNAPGAPLATGPRTRIPMLIGSLVLAAFAALGVRSAYHRLVRPAEPPAVTLSCSAPIPALWNATSGKIERGATCGVFDATTAVNPSAMTSARFEFVQEVSTNIHVSVHCQRLTSEKGRACNIGFLGGYFAVLDSGQWEIVGASRESSGLRSSPHINKSGANLIEVRQDGREITGFVNGQEVGHYKLNDEPSKGRVSVAFTGDAGTASKLRFSQFQLHDLGRH